MSLFLCSCSFKGEAAAHKALELDPNNQNAKDNLAGVLAAQAALPQTQTSGEILNGKAKSLVKPVYPAEAVKSGASGVVKISVTINEAGNVLTAEAVSGDALLRGAAVAAAAQTKFYPKIVQGKAVKMSGILVFNFAAPNTISDAYESSDQSVTNALNKYFKDEMDLLKLIKKYPEASKKGQELYDKGDYAGAVKVYTKEINGGSDNSVFYELRARAYFKLKDYNNALKDINTSIEKSSGKISAEQFTLRGDIYTQLKDNPKAIADYRKALELKPNEPFYQNNLKLALAQQQKSNAASTPNANLNNEANGKSCGEKDYDCQIAAASKAIQANPNDAAAYVKRGNAYDEKGNSNQAILDYNKAIELDPKNASAYYNRAIVYANKDDSGQAILDYSKAIELNRKYAPAYDNRGDLYLKRNLFYLAAADFTEAVELKPDNKDYQKHLELTLAKQKKIKEASKPLPMVFDDDTERNARTIEILNDLGNMASYYAADKNFNALNLASASPAEICRTAFEFKKALDNIEPSLDALRVIYIEFFEDGEDFEFNDPEITERAEKTVKFHDEVFPQKRALVKNAISKYGCK